MDDHLFGLAAIVNGFAGEATSKSCVCAAKGRGLRGSKGNKQEVDSDERMYTHPDECAAAAAAS